MSSITELRIENKVVPSTKTEIILNLGKAQEMVVQGKLLDAILLLSATTTGVRMIQQQGTG